MSHLTRENNMNKFKLKSSVVKYARSQYNLTTVSNYFANKKTDINKDNENDLAKEIVDLVNLNIGQHANIKEVKIKYLPNHHELLNGFRKALKKPLIKSKFNLYWFGGKGWEVRFHQVAQ